MPTSARRAEAGTGQSLIYVKAGGRQCERDIRQRLDAIRYAIDAAECDELIVGLELYEMRLKRDLDRMACH
jgi:hypothetical protein